VKGVLPPRDDPDAVTRGHDPRVHLLRRRKDRLVMPGDDARGTEIEIFHDLCHPHPTGAGKEMAAQMVGTAGGTPQSSESN
jgi:hypothetical protein